MVFVIPVQLLKRIIVFYTAAFYFVIVTQYYQLFIGNHGFLNELIKIFKNSYLKIGNSTRKYAYIWYYFNVTYTLILYLLILLLIILLIFYTGIPYSCFWHLATLLVNKININKSQGNSLRFNHAWPFVIWFWVWK